MIRIAVIDDQPIFRESLAKLIETVPGFCCAVQCGGSAAFLSVLQQPDVIVPDIVLLDLEMPGMNGIELNTLLQKQYPALKIIILSVHANEKLIASLIRAGADGYLTKNCDKDELIKAINMVQENGYYINQLTLQALQQNTVAKGGTQYNVNNIPIELSKRETEILELICREYNNAEIAAQLYISVRTVEGHRNNILHKTGCRNTAGLVLFAIRHNIYTISF